MTVHQVLNSMDSVELSEWMAYERVHGPLGNEWRDEVDASIHELLQQLSYLQSQAHFTDKNHKKGPVPKPTHYPRPSEASDLPGLEDDDSDEEWLPPGGTEDDDITE